jgi:choline transport protein
MDLTWHRDGGLPFSKFFAKVHPKLQLPVNALVLTVTLDVIFGCIFLGSSAAFNAILSASVVALGVSYAMPILINCLRGRKMLGERPFVLPGPFGWIANIVCVPPLSRLRSPLIIHMLTNSTQIGIVYVIVTTVLFVFPPDLPVDGSSMNYCIVAFAIVIIIATVQWFIDGKKNFHGPKVDLVALQEGEVVTMDPSSTNTDIEDGKKLET